MKIDEPKRHLTMRAPDWWDSARFQALFVARSWFRQNGVVSSRQQVTQAVGQHGMIFECRLVRHITVS